MTVPCEAVNPNGRIAARSASPYNAAPPCFRARIPRVALARLPRVRSIEPALGA